MLTNNNKPLLIMASIAATFFLSSCSTGDTSVETLPVTGGNVPSEFVGTYRGTINAEAKRGLLEASLDDPITIIVRSNNTIEFLGDDPDERFVTTIGSNGNFNGVLPIDASDCSGDINVSGTVNGTTASGELGGEGRCDGIGSVGVSGSFLARK